MKNNRSLLRLLALSLCLGIGVIGAQVLGSNSTLAQPSERVDEEISTSL